MRSLDRVKEIRRKRNSTIKTPFPRICKGQRKESSDLKRERGKIEMVPGMISGERSTEKMANAVKGI